MSVERNRRATTTSNPTVNGTFDMASLLAAITVVNEETGAIDIDVSSLPRGSQQTINAQADLSARGLYVSPSHRYYKDAIAGEITQFGFKMAAAPEQATDYLNNTALKDIFVKANDVTKLQIALNANTNDKSKHIKVDASFGPETAGRLTEHLEQQLAELGPEKFKELKDGISDTILEKLAQHGDHKRLEALGIDAESYHKAAFNRAAKASEPSEFVKNHEYGRIIEPILMQIKRHESRGGDYETMNGFEYPVTKDGRPATKMTLQEVYDIQEDRRLHPEHYPKAASGAMGAYQMIPKTLKSVANQMGLDPETTIFDEELQDRMAVHLLEEAGLSKFMKGQMSEDQFMKNVGDIWSSFPVDKYGNAAHGGIANNPYKVGEEVVSQAQRALREAKANYEEHMSEKVTQNDRTQSIEHVTASMPRV